MLFGACAGAHAVQQGLARRQDDPPCPDYAYWHALTLQKEGAPQSHKRC